MTDSCSILEIKIKSSLRSMKPETWFYLKVKRLTSGFLILQMSHKKSVFLISISFKIGFPPDASKIIDQKLN